MYFFLRYTFLIILLVGGIGLQSLRAQSDTTKIPHRTAKEILMWPHRTFFRFIMKEPPPVYDTTYIKGYRKHLVLTLPLTNRYLNFGIRDNISNRSIQFAPNNGHYDIGIGLNSHRFGLVVNTGISLFKGDVDKKGKTKFRDYQLNIYGKRVVTDLSFQNYNGFYVRNTRRILPSGITLPGRFELRPDIEAYSIGVSSLYIFNYKKFSYRGSFAFTEKQLKSAGSFVAGVYYTFMYADSDSSIISSNFRSVFDSSIFLKKAITQNGGINLGYIHTLVIKKKSYVTLSLVNGMGAGRLHSLNVMGERKNSSVTLSVKTSFRIAAGFDDGKFFGGGMGIFDVFAYSTYSDISLDHGLGKFRVFLGYRFNVLKEERRLLKKLKIIEWEESQKTNG
jgi:hypothetical protein